MNPAGTSVSICFPAYNEEPTLAAVLQETNALAQTILTDYEIIVCNDGSGDRTPAILEEMRAKIPRLKVLTHAKNQGLTATFLDLYAAAQKDWVFLNATDGQWPNRILLDLYANRDGADIVASVRQDKHYGPVRAVISFLYNLIPVVLFGCSTRDAGGVKLIAAKFVRETKIISRSPFADAERMIRAARRARFKFVPVEIAPRLHGSTKAIKWKVMIQCALDVVRLRLALWKGG